MVDERYSIRSQDVVIANIPSPISKEDYKYKLYRRNKNHQMSRLGRANDIKDSSKDSVGIKVLK